MPPLWPCFWMYQICFSYFGTSSFSVSVSSDLSWNKHVDNTVKEATTSFNFLKWNLHGCHTGVKDLCYKPLLRPILEYFSCVWGPYSQRKFNKLEMVQRRAAWFVKGEYEKTSSVTSMLTDLHWNILHERRMQVKSAMLYRTVHNLVAIPVTPFHIPVRTSRGNSMKFFIPQSTVNSHLYSFFPSTIGI